MSIDFSFSFFLSFFSFQVFFLRASVANKMGGPPFWALLLIIDWHPPSPANRSFWKSFAKKWNDVFLSKDGWDLKAPSPFYYCPFQIGFEINSVKRIIHRVWSFTFTKLSKLFDVSYLQIKGLSRLSQVALTWRSKLWIYKIWKL